MRGWLFGVIALCLSLCAGAEETASGAASPAPKSAPCTLETRVTDVIGPATVDLLKRVEAQAARAECGSILLLINTPGGSLESTRILVSAILNSPVPYLCLVAPSGGHAGSAGAILLQACHVSGALRGTNLGAATPVSLGGEMPKDLREKILNDTRSWLESLTRLRGRSRQFGEDIILKAKAVTAEEALKLNAIDFVGDSKEQFLTFAQGRTVKLAASKDVQVAVGPLEIFALDTRYKVVSVLTDPQFAYILLLGSLALLYFEITHPGTMVAGVLGGIGLIVAMIALHKLDVEWAGLLLIFLGIGLLIAEMFLPTFGILGAGGVAAFVLGSLFLFDPVKTGGYRLPLSLILPVAGFFMATFIGVSVLVLRTARVKKKGGFEDLMGLRAKVVDLEISSTVRGKVELRGEIWNFQSDMPVGRGDEVLVTGHEGLVLFVRKA